MGVECCAVKTKSITLFSPINKGIRDRYRSKQDRSDKAPNTLPSKCTQWRLKSCLPAPDRVKAESMTNTPDDAKGHGRVTARISSAAALLLLITVLALHFHVASVILGSSLGSGDPQRHFVSGVMCYDYLRTGLGSNPIRFAEGFEVRYPEVAIGHWPPMYYAVQALYYFLAGPTIRSAQLLSAMTAALLATLLFLSLRRETGVNLAIVAVAVFLAAPLV
jgi:hypothetical protein